jgi:hypothetical protein
MNLQCEPSGCYLRRLQPTASYGLLVPLSFSSQKKNNYSIKTGFGIRDFWGLFGYRLLVKT